jgi:hypothetical protein
MNRHVKHLSFGNSTSVATKDTAYIPTLSLSPSTTSQCTIIEKKLVPSAINHKYLKATLKRYQDTSANEKLQRILDFSIRPVNLSQSAHKRFLSTTVKFNENLLISEFTSITSKKIWNSVLNNFKNKPQRLFNIINQSPFQKPNRRVKNNLQKDKKIFSTFDCTIRVDNQPKQSEIATFLELDKITDDWFNSLLYYKVCNNIEICCELEQEIADAKLKIPRTHDGIEQGINRALEILEGFLLEMLGTKTDLNNFKEKYSSITIAVYELIYQKCEHMLEMRRKTVELLKLVKEREDSLAALVNREGNKDEIIYFICNTNKRLRVLIKAWIKNSNVPFDCFIFKGEKYLHKMQMDALLMQDYL